VVLISRLARAAQAGASDGFAEIWRP